jgi:CRP/FNR family cyclic AMP-dependent transcriptional regulator
MSTSDPHGHGRPPDAEEQRSARLALLGRTALFKGVPARELEELAVLLQRRIFARGVYLWHTGDAAEIACLVVRGQVKVSRINADGEEFVTGMFLPGEVFGEMSLVVEDPVRLMDAQAVEPTECLTLSREAFLHYLDDHPRVLRRMLATLASNIRRMDETFSESAFLDIPGRVARKLLDLAELHGEQTADGIRIRMRLSQGTLAGMVTASRENVNRSLSRFASEGLIKLDSGSITIVDQSRLRRYA